MQGQEKGRERKILESLKSDFGNDYMINQQFLYKQFQIKQKQLLAAVHFLYNLWLRNEKGYYI